MNVGQESVLEGALRELNEECGAVVKPQHARKVATIDFEFEGDPKLMEVHVFIAEKWSGERRIFSSYKEFLTIYFDLNSKEIY